MRNQRILRRITSECFSYLPHHTLSHGGPKRFSPQCSLCSAFNHHPRGNLNHHVGGMFASIWTKEPSSALRTSEAQRLRGRLLPFLSPETLDALTLASRRSDDEWPAAGIRSTRAVLPMPASPVTKMACRCPAERWRDRRQVPQGAFPFPTDITFGELGDRPASRRSQTDKLVPRRKGLIYDGFSDRRQ